MAFDLDQGLYPDLSSPPAEFGKALPVEETTTSERRPTSSLPGLPLKAPVTTSEQAIPNHTRDLLNEADASITSGSSSTISVQTSSPPRKTIHGDFESSITASTPAYTSVGSTISSTTSATTSSLPTSSPQISSFSSGASSSSESSLPVFTSTPATSFTPASSSTGAITSASTTLARPTVPAGTTIYPNAFAGGFFANTTSDAVTTTTRVSSGTTTKIAGLSRNQTASIVVGAVFGGFTLLFLVLWCYTKIANRRRSATPRTASLVALEKGIAAGESREIGVEGLPTFIR